MSDYLAKQGKKAEFNGKVYVVYFDDGIKGVLKTFPKNDQQGAYAEVAAFEASKVLGFPHVPPATLRNVKGLIGSISLLVETDIDLLADGVYEDVLSKANPETLANLKLFYFVLGQWDTGPHNLLAFVDQDEVFLIPIDNEGIGNRQHVHYGELPFVRIAYSDTLDTKDFGQDFPFDNAQTIEPVNPKILAKKFEPHFPAKIFQNISPSCQKFRYVVFENSLWRQFHTGNESFVKSFTATASSKTLQALKKLNLTTLKRIFAHPKGCIEYRFTSQELATPAYLKTILERRDQVLRYFENEGK